MKKNNTNIQKQNIGNAGEYYIAALLSALDFTVTITLGRAERFDILTVSPKGKTFKLSVKARYSQETSAFTLSEKDELGSSDDLFYVFVRLHEFKKTPEYWVIPSKKVSQAIIDSHKKWLATEGRGGRKHVDNPLRKVPVELGELKSHYYSDQWKKELNKGYNNFEQLLKK